MKTKTYKLTEAEIFEIAERELPEENFFEDGELNFKQAFENLKWLLENKRISRITYDCYMEDYS